MKGKDTIIKRRPKASYLDMLDWLFQNEDSHWVHGHTEKGTKDHELNPPKSVLAICLCFGYSVSEVADALKKKLSFKPRA